MSKKGDTNSLLNSILLINRPAVENCGEDAYAFSFNKNYGFISVFDGCGGLGAKKYLNYNNKTAAYIASRIAGITVLDWFEEQIKLEQNLLNVSEDVLNLTLKKDIDSNFQIAKLNLDVEKRQLIGSLVRSFPTTASIVFMKESEPNRLSCNFVWAGDSRGYILQPNNGLMQCTMDDLKIQEDAFDNLYGDSPLSNMLNGDGNYVLHSKKINCTTPSIIFTATDGTFGYLASPMHYEWMIIKTLQESQSINEWEKRLYEAISVVTGDDSTMVIAVYGWNSFKDIKMSFEKRYRILSSLLDQPNMTQENLKKIWEKYKTGYEKLISDNKKPE